MITGRLKSFMDVGDKVVISVEFPTRAEATEWLKDHHKPNAAEPLEVEIRERKKQRSLSANSYMWTLLDQLAQKLRTSKQELYKHYITHYGTYVTLTCKNTSLRSFIRIWESQGLGWQVEIEADYGEKLDVRAYHGSSSYDTKAMSRLIDQVVEDCKEQGIETLTPAEIEELKANWKK